MKNDKGLSGHKTRNLWQIVGFLAAVFLLCGVLFVASQPTPPRTGGSRAVALPTEKPTPTAENDRAIIDEETLYEYISAFPVSLLRVQGNTDITMHGYEPYRLVRRTDGKWDASYIFNYVGRHGNTLVASFDVVAHQNADGLPELDELWGMDASTLKMVRIY